MVASLGPPSLSPPMPPPQGGPRRPRCRRCLLKGCEQLFRPSRPQTRYGSDACRHEARRWRRWRASQKYRASPRGKERRQGQSQRCRDRHRQGGVAGASVVAAISASDQPPPSPPPAAPAPAVAAAVPRDRGTCRVGQRPAIFPKIFLCRACQRPGCYELFVVTPRSPEQHFCSASCRRALRRVLDREARWRRRQRQRPGARHRRPHPPPTRC
jgi:hypothetical protein